MGSVADRCTIDTIAFGDGTYGSLSRINGTAAVCPTCMPCGCDHCGEIIIDEPGYRVKKNIYIIEHVYPGPGSYTIRIVDPNRNEGVENIPLSDQQPFYLESLLIINGFTGANSSPEFKYPPIDRACFAQCFYHNPGAFDVDGDSLSYVITTSRSRNGVPVPGYFYPPAGAGGTYNIDPITGLLTWCSPQKQGEYNVAFIVYEWRRNTSGKYEIIGSVLRDMQILVNPCPKNLAPFVSVPADTCVEAGSLIIKTITVHDPDTTNIVTLEMESGAAAAVSPIATISQTIGTMLPANNFEYTSTFSWQTSCAHIRYQPYYTTFKVRDNGSPALAHFATYAIRVVPPAVKNVSAAPQGVNMLVSWSAVSCNDAANPLYRYRVYRQKGCIPVEIASCTRGVPSNSGYELIASLSPTTTSLLDNNNGKGLVVGQNYSYLVTAIYRDSSTTFASTNFCAELKRDLPVPVNVDVDSTATTNGAIIVRWINALTSPGNLDLSVYKGPYKIVLLHRDSSASNFTQVYSTSVVNFSNLPTSYTHSPVNSASHQHEYQLGFYSDTVLLGYTQTATSVFLNYTPSDRKIDLNWRYATPWDNYLYTVFRADSGSVTWQQIGTTTLTSFSDNSGLVNLKPYAYYVLSTGKYDDTTIVRPLLNRSQILYAKAIDNTAPVSPTIDITADCAMGNVQISWTDIKPLSDDVASYQLFFKPTLDGEWSIVTVVKEGDLLVYKTDGLTSIAGCYAVNATDKNGNTGEKSADFCIDNCPEFLLPNIFTPNGDGANDFFQAVKVRQINQIDLTILDRWGNVAYKTNDPFFKWDGITKVSNNSSSDGTFVYVCDVYEQRVNGVSKRSLSGTIQLMR